MTGDEQFDPEAFVEWLDDYEGHVLRDDLLEEWPEFPLQQMAYQTCPIVDGGFAYYQHDLRRIAEGRPVWD